jgi:hypothetical protein
MCDRPDFMDDDCDIEGFPLPSAYKSCFACDYFKIDDHKRLCAKYHIALDGDDACRHWKKKVL